MFSKEKRKLDIKIDKLSEANTIKLKKASNTLITMYLSTLITESLILDLLETAVRIDTELEEIFNNVEGI